MRTDTAEVVTATADTNGTFAGPVIWGSVDVETGIVRLKFTADPDDTSGASDIPVIPALLRYNAVLYSSLPLNAELIGLDPVRLPADGRVPIYREGDVLVIQHTAETVIASPVAGATETLARAQQAAIEVVDAAGIALDPAQYTADRELGTVTWANPLILQDVDTNPLALPLTIRDRVEHMAVCSEVQISGALSIGAPLPWDLPAGETQVSSAVAWGDLQARLHTWYTQKTWNSGAPNWTDSPSGDSTTSNYNSLNYPPVATNKGAIAGKWAIVFTSATAFNVVEEKLGVITTGSTGSDCAPTNPATNAPYFTILAAGWGSGWAAGNAVRFDTDSCLGPLWIVRTVLSGQGSVEDDQFRIQIRGMRTDGNHGLFESGHRRPGASEHRRPALHRQPEADLQGLPGRWLRQQAGGWLDGRARSCRRFQPEQRRGVHQLRQRVEQCGCHLSDGNPHQW
ncbi:hypothetical protein ACFSHR_05705 [Azotobacter chroococcum]